MEGNRSFTNEYYNDKIKAMEKSYKELLTRMNVNQKEVTKFKEEASTLVGEKHMLTEKLDVAEQNFLDLQSKLDTYEKENDEVEEGTIIFYLISLS